MNLFVFVLSAKARACEAWNFCIVFDAASIRALRITIYDSSDDSSRLKINFGLTFASDVFSDERDAIQKKTFTKWINNHLRKAGGKVTDLFQDLRDGQSLLTLLELLSNEKLVSTWHSRNPTESCNHTTHSHAKEANCGSTCCRMSTRRWAFFEKRRSSWWTSDPMTSLTEIRSWLSDSFGRLFYTSKWVFTLLSVGR